MSTGMRVRIIVLQVGLVGIFAFAALILYGAGSFVQTQIRDQLTAQQIYFPPASEVKAGGALDPAVYSDITKYAGQQVTNGDQAKAYANGFIGRHLVHIANGQTYSQVSSKSLKNPDDTALAAQVQTLFRGETLRGLLLNAYGWWTVGTYALLGAYGVAAASGAVFVALLFEVGAMIRSRNRVTHPSRRLAPVPA